MNWSRASSYLMAGEHGYKVAKYICVGQAQYRASVNGRFLGTVQLDYESARQVCESHFQIMGAEEFEPESAEVEQ